MNPLVGASLYAYDHRPTCIDISQDTYLLAFDRSRMLVVISVDMRVKACYRPPIYCLCLSASLSLWKKTFGWNWTEREGPD